MFWYSTKSMIVFYEAVQRKSFTRAAEALFMTQPGISFHITGLESYLGVKLLNRKDNKFELTAEGKAVFKYAEKVYKIQADFEKLVLEFKGKHIMRLTIGAPRTANTACQRLSQALPAPIRPLRYG
jgi:DNA-binding transcriptional LysR family regulator